MNKTTEALKLAKEALHNTGNALMCLTTTRKLRPLYQEMRDDAVEGCNNALSAIREALAEQALQNLSDFHQHMEATDPVKQEPVAWAYIDADGSFMDALPVKHGAYQTPLYAAPVDAKAVRAKALDEAAEVCENIEPPYWTETRNKCAAAIRGLK